MRTAKRRAEMPSHGTGGRRMLAMTAVYAWGGCVGSGCGC